MFKNLSARIRFVKRQRVLIIAVLVYKSVDLRMSPKVFPLLAVLSFKRQQEAAKFGLAHNPGAVPQY